MRIVIDHGRGLERVPEVGAELAGDPPDPGEVADDQDEQHGHAPRMAAQESERQKMQAHGTVPDGTTMLSPVASRPRARPVRHNRRVTEAFRRSSILLPPLLALALAACGQGGSDSRQAAAARFDNPDAELRWQGVLACADCDGIDTRLRLERGNGVVSQYELVEAFLDGEGAEYFREEGRWRRDGRIVRLQPTSGGERLFALDGAGNLVVVDSRGHLAGPGRTLTPIAPPKM
jgi:hypothetical protein